MALLEKVDAEVMQGTTQDETNAALDAAIKGIKGQVDTITADYVTSKNIQPILRGTPPKYHQASAKVDWNELEFGNHMMRSIGDGSTHAPPTNGQSVFFYTEVILTHVDGQYQNKLQRAWEYRGGKLHVRSFVSGTWYPWTTTTADAITVPEEPTE